MIKHGMRNTRLYGVWQGIRKRCLDEESTNYERYGGRGIKICEEWKDFTQFANWALSNGFIENAKRGECTIERIDNDGDYCPENCIWANAKQQANNRSNNRTFLYDGKRYTITQLSDRFGIRKDTLRRRLTHGWSVEEAVGKPLNYGKTWRGAMDGYEPTLRVSVREAAKLTGKSRAFIWSRCSDNTFGECWGNGSRKSYRIFPTKLAQFIGISEEDLQARLAKLRGE